MRTILTIFFTLLAFNANADLRTEMHACTTIVDNLARLTCFDQLAAKMSQKSAEKVGAAEQKPPAVTKTETSITPAPAVVAPKVEPVAQSKQQQVDNFGKKAEQVDEIESIQANMVGEFRGWVKGKIITLDNGQKWKVVGASKGYIRLMNPPVKIEKAIFGSFNMRVEGFTPFAKVKRIK